MKKLLAILLSVLMLCTMIPFATVSVAAEEGITIVVEVSEEEINAGDEFEVTVILEGNPGLIGAGVEIEFDSDALEVVGEWEDGVFYPFFEHPRQWKGPITYGPPGTCTVQYTDGTATANVTKEEYFTVVFKAKDDAYTGNYDLTVKYNPNNYFAMGFAPVAVVGVVDGSITINGRDPEPEVPSCEHEYFTPCDQHCMLCGELTNPDAAHNVIAVEAKDATCYEDGNIAYWYCDVCGAAWLDAECTLNTNLKSVVLPMAHAEATHVAAKAATCYEDGNIEYWYCADCGQAWLDEACTLNTNLKAVILPMAHAEATHVEAKAPTCTENGNIEYWYCADCGQAWLDAECTLNTNLKAVVLGATCSTNAVYTAAKAATCFEPGNVEYWYCANCDVYYLDAACTMITNAKSVILPIAHNVIHVEAKAPTCTENGNIEYWYCDACGSAWLDELCHLNTNLKAVVLGATCSTNAVYTAAKAPTCFEPGNVEYWYCANCDVYYLDAACTIITNAKSVILPIAHNVIHVEAKAPTCTENGNIEYWYCADCGQAWLDELCHLNTNLKAVVLGTTCSTNAVYTAAKAATCFEPGNVEYWYCANCDVYYLDAECTMITNAKSVILPIAHNVIHVEAKAATCYENGNIEYWYCADCGSAWLDELCHLNTNLKAVVLPMGHGTIIAVEAAAPTCTENGNIAYWYCEACGQAWLDEACTLNTNLKAVILPAAHTYDGADDVVCNICGDIAEGEYKIATFSGNSVSEDVSGLAFLFNMNVSDITILDGTRSTAVYDASFVIIDGVEYALKGMGAMVSNNGEIATSLETGANMINIKANYLYNLEAFSASFAVRVTGIPASAYDVDVTAVPYIIYENAEGEEIAVFGAAQASSVNDVLNG